MYWRIRFVPNKHLNFVDKNDNDWMETKCNNVFCRIYMNNIRIYIYSLLYTHLYKLYLFEIDLNCSMNWILCFLFIFLTIVSIFASIDIIIACWTLVFFFCRNSYTIFFLSKYRYIQFFLSCCWFCFVLCFSSILPRILSWMLDLILYSSIVCMRC